MKLQKIDFLQFTTVSIRRGLTLLIFKARKDYFTSKPFLQTLVVVSIITIDYIK